MSKNSEKKIENSIKGYNERLGAIVESNQGGKVYIKKWPKTYSINLQTIWCPDLTWLYNWHYFWIEVKKDQKSVDDWLKIEERYNWIGKPPPATAEREINQIKYKNKILDNWWYFLLTCELEEAIEFINDLT